MECWNSGRMGVRTLAVPLLPPSGAEERYIYINCKPNAKVREEGMMEYWSGGVVE